MKGNLRSALAVLHSVKGKLRSASTKLRDFEGKVSRTSHGYMGQATFWQMENRALSLLPSKFPAGLETARHMAKSVTLRAGDLRNLVHRRRLGEA